MLMKTNLRNLYLNIFCSPSNKNYLTPMNYLRHSSLNYNFFRAREKRIFTNRVRDIFKAKIFMSSLKSWIVTISFLHSSVRREWNKLWNNHLVSFVCVVRPFQFVVHPHNLFPNRRHITFLSHILYITRGLLCHTSLFLSLEWWSFAKDFLQIFIISGENIAKLFLLALALFYCIELFLF